MKGLLLAKLKETGISYVERIRIERQIKKIDDEEAKLLKEKLRKENEPIRKAYEERMRKKEEMEHEVAKRREEKFEKEEAERKKRRMARIAQMSDKKEEIKITVEEKHDKRINAGQGLLTDSSGYLKTDNKIVASFLEDENQTSELSDEIFDNLKLDQELTMSSYNKENQTSKVHHQFVNEEKLIDIKDQFELQRIKKIADDFKRVYQYEMLPYINKKTEEFKSEENEIEDRIKRTREIYMDGSIRNKDIKSALTRVYNFFVYRLAKNDKFKSSEFIDICESIIIGSKNLYQILKNISSARMENLFNYEETLQILALINYCKVVNKELNKAVAQNDYSINCDIKRIYGNNLYYEFINTLIEVRFINDTEAEKISSDRLKIDGIDFSQIEFFEINKFDYENIFERKNFANLKEVSQRALYCALEEFYSRKAAGFERNKNANKFINLLYRIKIKVNDLRKKRKTNKNAESSHNRKFAARVFNDSLKKKERDIIETTDLENNNDNILGVRYLLYTLNENYYIKIIRKGLVKKDNDNMLSLKDFDSLEGFLMNTQMMINSGKLNKLVIATYLIITRDLKRFLKKGVRFNPSEARTYAIDKRLMDSSILSDNLSKISLLIIEENNFDNEMMTEKFSFEDDSDEEIF